MLDLRADVPVLILPFSGTEGFLWVSSWVGPTIEEKHSTTVECLRTYVRNLSGGFSRFWRLKKDDPMCGKANQHEPNPVSFALIEDLSSKISWKKFFSSKSYIASNHIFLYCNL